MAIRRRAVQRCHCEKSTGSSWIGGKCVWSLKVGLVGTVELVELTGCSVEVTGITAPVNSPGTAPGTVADRDGLFSPHPGSIDEVLCCLDSACDFLRLRLVGKHLVICNVLTYFAIVCRPVSCNLSLCLYIFREMSEEENKVYILPVIFPLVLCFLSFPFRFVRKSIKVCTIP